MRRSAAFGLLLLAAAVAACSNPGDAGDTAGVLAVDDQFLPDVLEVDPGTTVEWKVEGDNPHNVVAADGSWQSPQVMERGDRFTRAFEAPGVYPYYCTFHGTPEGEGMAGYLVVGDVPAYERPERRPLPTVAAWTGVTRRVPGDYPTIQDAVDAADPGDLVLIAPGIYREAVVVRTPSLVIRGEDRNTTILDGGFELTNGIQVVADHAEGEEGRQNGAGDAEDGVELLAPFVRRVLKVEQPQGQSAQEGKQKDPAQFGGAVDGGHDQFLWASRS